MLQASIITIGDELLIGQVVDTNSAAISRVLGGIGVKVRSMISIADDQNSILESLKRESGLSDIVITTGGLGPTKDDITKKALAEFAGSDGWYYHEGQLAEIHRILGSRGLDVLQVNTDQALVPKGCEVIVNHLGTAPVMVFRGKSSLYSLPGVPFEAVAALPDIAADIREHYSLSSIYHRNLMVYGIAESKLSNLIAPWEDNLPEDIHLAYLPSPLTGIRLRISVYGEDETSAEKRVSGLLPALYALLGDYLYSEADDTLEGKTGRILKANSLTLAAAESCTGGEIAHLITTVPGSSAYFLGSVTSYAVSVKEKVLGVPHETIAEYGVVSSEVAAAMAEGARRVLGADYAVATTGLAGPGGDESNKEGTVWIAVASERGTVTEKRVYSADRKRNIERFAASALDLLRRCLQKDGFTE